MNAETLVAKIIDLQPRDSASSTTTTSATNLQTDGMHVRILAFVCLVA